MSRRNSCWLLVMVVLCLLAAVPAQGADGGKTREVSIPGTGLAFRVPRGVAVWPKKPASSDGTSLSVAVETIESFRDNGIVGIPDVLAQRAALARGEAEVAADWEEDGLSEAVPLPTGGYAVMYPWYSPFEYCAIQFTLSAAFFVGNRRVTISYTASPEVITRENPGYFQGAGENDCEAATIWKQPGEEDDQILQRFHERRSRLVAWGRQPPRGTPNSPPSWLPCIGRFPRGETLPQEKRTFLIREAAAAVVRTEFPAYEVK